MVRSLESAEYNITHIDKIDFEITGMTNGTGNVVWDWTFQVLDLVTVHCDAIFVLRTHVTQHCAILAEDEENHPPCTPYESLDIIKTITNAIPEPVLKNITMHGCL